MVDINVDRQNRFHWDFAYTAGELAEATTKLVAYHEGRLAWWLTEREVAEESVKGATITTRTIQQTGGDRIEVSLDPALSNRLSECQHKIAEHRAQIKDWTIWHKSFARLPEKQLFWLKPDDLEFFRLHDPDLDES